MGNSVLSLCVHIMITYPCNVNPLTLHFYTGEGPGLVVRASDSGSGDPGSILGRVGVLFP